MYPPSLWLHMTLSGILFRVGRLQGKIHLEKYGRKKNMNYSQKSISWGKKNTTHLIIEVILVGTHQTYAIFLLDEG